MPSQVHKKSSCNNEKLSSLSQHRLKRLFTAIRPGGKPIFRVFHEVQSRCRHLRWEISIPQQYGDKSTDSIIPEHWWKKSFLHTAAKNTIRQRTLQSIFQPANCVGNATLILPADFFSQSAELSSNGGNQVAMRFWVKISLPL